MISKILSSSLFRASGIYTISAVINAAIPFLMMPILTRYLTPTDYGIVSMFSVMVGIVSIFVGVNTHGAISVKYFDKSDTNMSKYVGNCFLILGISSALVYLVLWIFSDFVSRYTLFPRGWLWGIVLYCVCQFVILVLTTLWQVKNEALKYSVFQNAQTLFNVGISLLFVVTLGMNWQGRINAQIITMVLFGLLGLFILCHNKWVTFEYDRNYINHALKFGAPLIPHLLGGMLITQTSRIFITNMVGVSETGIYTVGYQIGMILELLVASFNRAYAPWLYEKLSENNVLTKVKIVKFTYAYFVVIFVLAILIALVSPWFLSYFIGAKFSGAHQYTVWIVIGFAFNGMYYMVTNYIFYANKTHVLAVVTFITALINIVLNYTLIKINGPVGAAQASALAFFTCFVLTWVLSARVYKMPWNIFSAKV